MYQVLIVEKDIKKLKFLINSIYANFKNIQICGITLSEAETINYLKHYMPSFIIVDIDSTFAFNKLLNYFETNNLEHLIQSVILISEIKCIYSSMYVYRNTSFQFKLLIKSLAELLEKTNSNFKKKINKELTKLNFNFSYIGTKYLSESIEIVMHRNLDIYNINLNNDVYSIIAKRHNKTINNIKTNIIRATTNMYYDCNEDFLNKYMTYVCSSKPSTKDIIYNVILNIK